jgi:8-oxo-dGTP pyrophosphatase MutT (NUDIX family)
VQHESGYERRERRIVYQNPWVRFEHHAMVHPNGRPGEHGVVVTPVASAVVVLDGDDVVLTRQARYAVDREVVEVVKGGAGDGESALACAQRELREELGLQAARWDALGCAYEIPSIVQEPVQLFLARDLTTVPAEPEEVESIAPLRMGLAAALEAVACGAIDDAVTALALVRAAHRVQRGCASDAKLGR